MKKIKYNHNTHQVNIAYGMRFADVFEGTADRFQYGGKEIDRFSGLDLHDFSARWYDQQLCRFTTPDPLQEKYPHLSPYLYCAPNPLRYTDPTGMVITVLTKDDQVIFMSHLKKVFGDTFSESFSFSEDGTLQNQNSEFESSLTKDQLKVYSEIKILIENSENTTICFDEKYEKKIGNIIYEYNVINDYEGGIYDSDTNMIIVSPSIKKNVNNDFYGRDSNKKVFVDTTTVLFHEMFERKWAKKERSKIIDYENIVRKILRNTLKENKYNIRGYDVGHY